MAKEKNPNQIIRLDGNGCFLEVMKSAFGIGKVQINFREYDKSRPKGDRYTQEIDLYIDIDKFLVLATDVLSGRIPKIAEVEKKRAEEETKKKGSKVYPSETVLSEYTDMGGMNPDSLERSDKRRKEKNLKPFSEMYSIPKGKCLSRQLKIFPGASQDFMLKGEAGIGEENDTGLIVPKYGNKPSQMIRVPLPTKDLKRLVLIVQAHIQSYITSQYIVEATAPQTEQRTDKK